MNALKGIVLIMTLAIAVLMTLIVYGLYQKSQDPDFKFIDFDGDDQTTRPVDGDAKAPVAPQTNTDDVHLKTFGDVTLNIPAQAQVRSATLSAGRLILILDTPGGAQIWIVDPADGDVLGRILTQSKDGT